MKEIEEMVTSLVNTYEVVKGADVLMPKNTVIGKCPHCGNEVIERQKGWFCANRECRFVLWKDNGYFNHIGKRLTAHIVNQLLRDGRAKLKDCKSYSFDPYEYFDSVEDRMEAVQSLKNHILSGDLKNIKDLLQTAIDEESEYADVAKEPILRLDEYSMKYQSKEKKPSILDKLQEHKIECSENGRKKPTKSRVEVR